MSGRGVRAGVCATVIVLTALPARALNFSFTPSAFTPQLVSDGFAAAGARWSSIFTDSVTIDINIDFTALAPGVLGSNVSTNLITSYTDFKSLLTSDRTSVPDFIAVGSLQGGPSFAKLVNYSAEHPIETLENDGSLNNTRVIASKANLKALGLTDAQLGPAPEASITFSSTMNWDFNPSDGITGGTYDFVGVATHEIGHALGFSSRVDSVDGINLANPLPSENQSAFYSTSFDLFRFSDFNGTIVNDFTAGSPGRVRYLSIDGGATNLGNLSLGRAKGDGRQAGHWKNNLGLGIMDPAAVTGELMSITPRDVLALDVIGWNVNPLYGQGVPEHSGASDAVLLPTLLALLSLLKHRSGGMRQPA